MAPPAAVVVVPAVADRADLPVLALAQVVAHRVRLPLAALLLWLLAKAHLAVLAVRSVVVVLVLAVPAALPVLARLVVEPAASQERPAPEKAKSSAGPRSRWPCAARPGCFVPHPKLRW